MKKALLGVIASLGFLAAAGCASGALDDEEFLYTPVGASDAVGIGAIPPTDGYVFRIERELEERGRSVELIVLGVPGAETDRMNDVVQAFLRTGGQPGLVTVWLGANDLRRGIPAEEFGEELEEILSAFRDETDAFIVIANIPDLSELPRFVEEPDPEVTLERVNAYNDVIEALAEEFDVPVVDLFAEEVDEALVSDVDGFHPNNEGHARVAELFLEVIRPEL